MSIFYKYCDQLGAVKILASLELKLPYISEVNDPYECLPTFYCKNDMYAVEERYLLALKRRNMVPAVDYKQKLDEQFKSGDIQNKLIESQRKLTNDWNQQKGCLLSVSKTARNTVMWAHYAERHKGVVIGIDFNKVLHKAGRKLGIKLSRVKYSKQRPKVDVLTETDGEVSIKALNRTLTTKSHAWRYEEEFRTVFLDDHLRNLQQQSLACFKDFNGKETWFLRIAPVSVKKVIFGLYTDESLKLAIRNFKNHKELRHVKFYQVVESENYMFKLIGQNV